MTKGCHVIDNVCVVLVGRIWSPNGNIICKGLHEDVTEFVVTGIPWVHNRWTRGGCQSSDLIYSSVLPRMCAFFELRCTPLPSSQMYALNLQFSLLCTLSQISLQELGKCTRDIVLSCVRTSECSCLWLITKRSCVGESRDNPQRVSYCFLHCICALKTDEGVGHTWYILFPLPKENKTHDVYL